MLVDTAMDLKLGLIKAVMGNFVSSALFHFNLGILDPIHTVSFDFCPVNSDLFTWSSVTKTFAILPANIIEYQIWA